MRSTVLFTAMALALLAIAGCGESPSADGPREMRIAMSGSNDDPALVRRRSAYKAYLAKVTGRPVKLFESSDYNGLVQALSSGQVDIAQLAGSGYANVYAQVGDKVTPLLTVRHADGDTGYYSALVVKADSPFRSLEDLKGRSLGYVDFNSTSGYLYPRARMRAAGIDPDHYFGKTSFAGGQTQSVMALENGQFDAAFVQVGGGDPVHGFTTGAVYTMARRGLVDVKDFRVIWVVGPIPDAAIVARTDRPQADIDLVRGAMASLPYEDPALWHDIGQLDGSAFAAIDQRHYAEVIALRNADISQRREGDKPAGGRP